MDAELKATWVAALRSGKYKQAKSVLKSSVTGFCCLGVLCSVMGAKWVNGEPILNGHTLRDLEGDELLNSDALELVGFAGRVQMQLVDLNDEGRPFPEIADYIEQNL